MGGTTTQYLVDSVNPTGYPQVIDELVSRAVTRTYAYGLQRIGENRKIGTTRTASFYGHDGHGNVRYLTGTAGTATDNQFHDIGVGVQAGNITDVGRYAVTHDEADRGKFKTPSLRDIALTAPYMHDGSLRNLKQVLDFYIGGGNSHANLDKEIHTLDYLTGQERRDLLAFLSSLTGEMPANVGPDLSGNSPYTSGP